MSRKIPKTEFYLIIALLVLVGLFIGLAVSQNTTIDRLQECTEKLQQKHALQCWPRLVNAPGQDFNFSTAGLWNDRPN